jgi:hypothetical protein
MDAPLKPAFRRFLSFPSNTAAAIVSVGIAALFSMVLFFSSYLAFPRRIQTFKGDPEQETTSVRKEFPAAPESPQNLWWLEIILHERPKTELRLDVRLNGTRIETRPLDGPKLVREFPASLLNEGTNVLEIVGDHGWTFKRLRIKNIYGYSSGAFSAVIAHQQNTYPEASFWPRSPFFVLILVIFFIAAAVFNAISEKRGYLQQPWLRRIKKARYWIPALFLAVLALPLVSPFRVWLGLPTVLALFLGFYALAFVFELGTFLRAAFVETKRALALFARRIGKAKHQAESLRKKRNLGPGILILGFAFFCLVYPGPGERKGDALEYYAMLVSWAEYFRPYVTEASCARMEKRLGIDSPPGENAFFLDLKERFPALLKNGTEMDLPHFWFYSLAAAVFYWPLRLFSLDIGLSFMLLHVLLLVAAFAVIRRKLGDTAGLSLMAVVFLSPLIWFINKVHVEVFTVVLAVVGVALLAAEEFAPSAFAFALAATQNPPFAVLAGLVFGLGLTQKKWHLWRNGFGFWLAAASLIVLQPAYYYLRLGIVNPVVATGAARIDQDVFSLKKMLCFIVDPDIGLLVNWPVALPIAAVFLYLVIRKRAALRGRVWVFLLFSIPILLWSQSRTMNLNHGGTYRISRYAIWFLYVFFLMIWQIGLWLRRTGSSTRRAWLGVTAAVGVMVIFSYWPTRPERYLDPTWASRLLYDRCPGIYDPMPEIFTERYRRWEENLPESVWAVSNPSGNKILVRRGRMMNIRSEGDLSPIETCPELNPVLVYKEARRRFAEARNKKYLYINGLGEKLRGSPAVAGR